MNILITCIEPLCGDTPTILYNNGAVEAKNSSEACCKYLLKRRGHIPDLIITLIMSDTAAKNLSDFIYFEKTIQDFCESEGIRVPSFKAVKISKSEKKVNHFGKSILTVRRIIRESSFSLNTRIMIDTSLKQHSMNTMFQMMTCLLKNDGYNRIKSYYADNEREHIVEENTCHLMCINEAITEFSEYGTAQKMKAYFESNSHKKTAPVVNRLMEAMQSFSDSIQLCQTEQLQDILNNDIFPTLKEVENMSVSPTMHEDVFTLKLMVENIRRKFGCNMSGDTFIITPMMLIEWCLKNRCIQQAVTLFVENIPKYLVSSGILQYDNALSNTLNSPEVNLLYTQIISACCTKGDDLSSNTDTISKLSQMELMKQYIAKGRLSEAEEDKIRIFVDTLTDFRYLIGDNRPQSAIRSYCPKNKGEQKLVELINKFNPTSYSKLVNTLKVQPSVLTAFINIMTPPRKTTDEEQDNAEKKAVSDTNDIDKKLNGIKNFSMKYVRKSLPGIKLNIKRDKIDYFRRFLAYYVYIKRCIRNYLNHAVEFNDTLNQRQIAEFESYSVHTGAITIQSISENIIDALKCLDECIIKDHRSIRPVKKYYINIPDSTLSAAKANRMNDTENQQSGTEYISFPIIPVIADSVREGDLIKIYGIRNDSENANKWENKLFEELNSLVIENDFDYEYEPINLEDSFAAAPMELFSRLVSTVVSGDRVYIDFTSIESLIPMTIMMFTNYLINYRKDTNVETAVYGKAASNSLICESYDITDLIFANNIISNTNAPTNSDDVLKAVMTYGRNNSTHKEKNIEITVNNMIYDEPYITETNNVSEIPQIKQNLTLSACSL